VNDANAILEKLLQYLPDEDYLVLRHHVLPYLPEARQSASKKAVDGIEVKLCRVVSPTNGRLPTPPALATALASSSFAPAPVHVQVPPTAPPTESGTPNSVATPPPMHPPPMLPKGPWDEEQALRRRPLSPPVGMVVAGAEKWGVPDGRLA
jgi:hypothetical protein